MYQSTMYVGLDVHKDSIDVALAPEGQGEVRSLGRIAGDLGAVDKILERLRKQHPRLSVVYEAGPCGYALYRHLTRKGVPCGVVAPSLIPKRPGDRIKTDRRDAASLARLHRAGDLTAVYVPAPEDEAVRDLSRSREDAVAANKRARQQLGALLLRNDVRYSGTKAWTLAHQRWLAEIKLPHPVQQAVFQEYLHAAEEANLRFSDQAVHHLGACRPAPRTKPSSVSEHAVHRLGHAVHRLRA